MKTSLLLISLLSSSIAIAECPDLAGTYRCQNYNDVFLISIEQVTNSNGVEVFKIDTGGETREFISDNIERFYSIPRPRPDYTAKGSVQAVCEGRSLKITNKGAFFGEMGVNLTIYEISYDKKTLIISSRTHMQTLLDIDEEKMICPKE